MERTNEIGFKVSSLVRSTNFPVPTAWIARLSQKVDRGLYSIASCSQNELNEVLARVSRSLTPTSTGLHPRRSKRALRWIARSDNHTTYNCYQKWSEWKVKTQQSLDRHPPKRLQWTYWAGHAGVKGKERAKGLAGKATITSRWAISQKIWSVEEFETYLQGTKPRSSLDRSSAEEMRRTNWSSARRFASKGHERSVVRRINIGIIWKAPWENFWGTVSSVCGLYRTHRNHKKKSPGLLQEFLICATKGENWERTDSNLKELFFSKYRSKNACADVTNASNGDFVSFSGCCWIPR